MKKLLLLFVSASFFLFASPVSADNGICNKTCQVNEECGKGYRCYVGICRALACPSSTSCECVPVTPTPLPKGVENLRVAPTPLPKATPVIAPSSQIEKTPKTGVSLASGIFISLGLASFGLLMKKMALRS